MANPDRKGGGGLSLRTLTIASAGSLTAAMVTSRLFPPGTIYASALTPVIVAAVSELLNRPADRVSQLRQQRRTLVMEAQRQRVAAGRSTPLPPMPEDEDDLAENGSATEAPITIHGRRRGLRRVHPKVWVATGLTAFVIAIAVLTLPELVFGGAVASNSRTTFFGGGGSSTSTQTTTSKQTSTTPTPTGTSTTQTVTQTTTTTTPTNTMTETTTTTTPTGTSTNPTGGAAPPPVPGTGTSTSSSP